MKEYPIGKKPPKGAKYKLYYFGYVQYHRTWKSVKKACEGLCWYYRQDAEIVKIT